MIDASNLPELLRASEVRALLRIEDNDQWRAVREAHPEMLWQIAGMKRPKYHKKIVLALLRQ